MEKIIGITEDYVSFETAKLLKEKGFDELTPLSYSLPYGYESRITCRNSNDTDFVSRITLQMAMKWLREVHKINIEIFTYWSIQERAVYGNRIVSIEQHANIFKEIDIAYDTYEQACEEAIKYCLENLI